MRHSSKQVLVLGGTGMVGSAIVQELKESKFQVEYTGTTISDKHYQLELQDYCDLKKLEELLHYVKPHFIVNALLSKEEPSNILINAGVPHFLERFGCQVIHISTNAVFRPEPYRFWSVEDVPTPISVYGATKLAGERAQSQLIIRTSVLGFRVNLTKKALREQFNRYSDKRGCWNGVTNKELAKRVAYHIREVKESIHYGIEHLASPVTSWSSIAALLGKQLRMRPHRATYLANEILLQEDKLGSDISPTRSLQEQILEL